MTESSKEIIKEKPGYISWFLFLIYENKFIMKIQIRRGVFETNSSSIHTLSISHATPDISKINSDGLFLGLFPETYRYDDSRSGRLQEKLDFLYGYCICKCTEEGSFSNYLKYKKMLSDALESIGVPFLFNEDGDMMENLWTGNFYYPVLENVFETKENIIDFLFNDQSCIDCLDRDYFWENEDEITSKSSDCEFFVDVND